MNPASSPRNEINMKQQSTKPTFVRQCMACPPSSHARARTSGFVKRPKARFDLLELPADILVDDLARFLDSQSLARLALTNKSLHCLLKPVLNSRLVKASRRREGLFFWAAVNGLEPIVKLLLENGIDPNRGAAFAYRGSIYWGNLYLGESTDRDWERVLTKLGCFENGSAAPKLSGIGTARARLVTLSQLPITNLGTSAYILFFPIHLAVFSGSLSVVDRLVRNGASLDAPFTGLKGLNTTQRCPWKPWLWDGEPLDTFWHKTPLYIAILKGNIEMARFLAGKSPRTSRSLLSTYRARARDDLNMALSPFHVALAAPGDSMARFVLQNSGLGELFGEAAMRAAKNENWFGNSPLWLACLNDNWEAVSWLLREVPGCDVNHDMGGGRTPLTYAIITNRFDAAIRLLEAGADINVEVTTLGAGRLSFMCSSIHQPQNWPEHWSELEWVSGRRLADTIPFFFCFRRLSHPALWQKSMPHRARVPDTDEMARYLRYVVGKGLVRVDQMRHPWDNRSLTTVLYDVKRQAVYDRLHRSQRSREDYFCPKIDWGVLHQVVKELGQTLKPKTK